MAEASGWAHKLVLKTGWRSTLDGSGWWRRTKSFILQGELSYVGAACPFMFQGERALFGICFFSVVINVVSIEVFHGEGKTGVDALVLHPCWHPVACQHYCTPRCTLHNRLGSNEMIEVTAVFQGISVNLTDIHILMFFSHFLEGRIKTEETRKMSWFKRCCRTAPGQWQSRSISRDLDPALESINGLS